MAPYRTLDDFARRFGTDRSNSRKWLVREGERLGIRPRQARPPESRGQAVLAWSPDEEAVLIAERRRQGYPIDGEDAFIVQRERARAP